MFFLNSTLLGVGLAMDAFSVSLANGLHEPDMKPKRMLLISGVFALFQLLMPLIGWICVHSIITVFQTLKQFVPWVAFLLLAYIGGKMLRDGIHSSEVGEEDTAVGFGALILQGIATSIDALSVGFTIADYPWQLAVAASVIIGVVTWIICAAGLVIGRTFGTKFAGKASVLGGAILIAIGLEILLKSLFGG